MVELIDRLNSQAAFHSKNRGVRSSREAASVMTEAAAHIAALEAKLAERVKVKPLEWVRVTELPTHHGGEPKRYWKASDDLGGWVWVNVHSEDFDGEASWGGEKYPSAAAAMSAADGHRRDRILSALED